MKLANIHAQIEAELMWRQDEIRFFQNLYQISLSSEGELDQARRTLILLLYAHFEGFIKFTLAIYVDSINSLGIMCGKADNALVAASLSRVFKDLRDPNKKAAVFRNTLPDDTQLHRIARDQEFVERTVEFKKLIVNIPSDYVDTESNLKPVVLRKNLFKLGFEHSDIDTVEDNINRLLGYRNSIAHGSRRDGIKKEDYDAILVDTYATMNFVKALVTRALREKKFRRDR